LRQKNPEGTSEQQSRRFKSIYPPDTGIDSYIHMHEVIEQSGRDIEKLIEHFKAYTEIDSERIGLTGFSMGGFATFYIAANNPAIKVAVPIGGKPSFTKAWEDVILSTSTYDQWSADIERLTEETEKRTTFLEEIDPFDKMTNFCPKPLLIINGDMDTDQIYLYSLELYKNLKPHYEAYPDRLRLSMPFVDHKLTYEIEKQACNWFIKYL
jgi:predicted acyl esterase